MPITAKQLEDELALEHRRLASSEELRVGLAVEVNRLRAVMGAVEDLAQNVIDFDLPAIPTLQDIVKICDESLVDQQTRESA